MLFLYTRVEVQAGAFEDFCQMPGDCRFTDPHEACQEYLL
jgi:hypothetical protein